MSDHMRDRLRSLHHLFFFSSRRRHTRFDCDWSSDVCSSDLDRLEARHAWLERASLLMLGDHVTLGGEADAETELDVSEARSEERRVGKEGRSRWSPYH